MKGTVFQSYRNKKGKNIHCPSVMEITKECIKAAAAIPFPEQLVRGRKSRVYRCFYFTFCAKISCLSMTQKAEVVY
jgi:hypothetical protein